MKSVRALGFGLTLLAAGAGFARAQGTGRVNYGELFAELDVNGDRVIEKSEVPESGRSAFETLLKLGDTNKNGKIDQDEYRQLLAGTREEGTRASAPASGSGQEDRFKAQDKNGDGKLSREEFTGPPELFEQIDADKDGFVTRDEAMKFFTGPGREAFLDRVKTMDKDGDGKVSKAEFTGQPQMFERLDTNKDGFLTKEEAAKFPGGPPGGAPGGAMVERIMAMDKNGDSKVSKDEFTGPEGMFERLDANKDGFVTKDEAAKLQGGPDGGPALAERFKEMDENSDGKLSKDEFPGPPPAFERFDTNQDGFLTLDELRAGFRARNQE